MNSLSLIALCCVMVVFGGLPFSSNAQLDPLFYVKTCPQLHTIVQDIIRNTTRQDPRIPPGLIRLHFHDCFVQGCDASVLLNKTATMESEQDALPNKDSLRGFHVVNRIKLAVDNACPNLVSCADILTLAAEKSSVMTGGPGWPVPLGRRDSLTANKALANRTLPAPFFNLTQLKAAFAAHGLNTVDLVALSGAHTFGRARCSFIKDRLYNFSNTLKPDPTLNTIYLQQLQIQCPQNGSGDNLVAFDPVTPGRLDKQFYNNLQAKKGLLQSDQELFSTLGADTISIVNSFASNESFFFEHFTKSMIKMGNIGVLTGTRGEIRKQCNIVNKKTSELDLAIELLEDDDMVSSI